MIDDLDDGFSIETDATVAESRSSNGSKASDSPSFALAPLPAETGWSRLDVPGSWGKYLHTAAMATPGDGQARAVFTAGIQVPGRYDVEYHIPSRRIPPTPGIANSERFLFGELGAFEITVRTPNDAVDVDFDGQGVGPGWHRLCTIDLGIGQVSVVVSNRTTGTVVVADAVRFLALDLESPMHGNAVH